MAQSSSAPSGLMGLPSSMILEFGSFIDSSSFQSPPAAALLLCASSGGAPFRVLDQGLVLITYFLQKVGQAGLRWSKSSCAIISISIGVSELQGPASQSAFAACC